MNEDPLFHAFISPHQSSDVFSHPNEVDCHSHRSAISVSPLLTASPVPRLLVSCACSMCQSVPVTGAGLPPVFPTCATPINQPHQQLVYQSEPLFKLQSLTDSVPDRPLRECLFSSLPARGQPWLFLDSCILILFFQITCLLSVPNHKLLSFFRPQQRDCLVLFSSCESIKTFYSVSQLCCTWVLL